MNRDWKFRHFFKGFAQNELLSCPACGGGLEYENTVDGGFHEWEECHHCHIRFHRDEALEITLNDVLLEAYLDAQQRIAELEAKLATPVKLPDALDAKFWPSGDFRSSLFEIAVAESVRTAGFKCEGA